ncbi:MAG: TIGR03905 family TSCPD domain-containing protein [Treponema sp.]|jgi:uncharacterized protein (TIGR03905 family)|nr:TIGR03905 family TSCPD domain-containing protein [Treponema sp.]
MYEYMTSGTCSSAIHFDIRDGKMYDISFEGGCNGNLKAIAKLVEGMETGTLIEKLKGVQCGMKATSCADQLAQAVEAYNQLQQQKAQ